jgi:hypothetical protein
MPVQYLEYIKQSKQEGLKLFLCLRDSAASSWYKKSGSKSYTIRPLLKLSPTQKVLPSPWWYIETYTIFHQKQKGKSLNEVFINARNIRQNLPKKQKSSMARYMVIGLDNETVRITILLQGFAKHETLKSVISRVRKAYQGIIGCWYHRGDHC